MPAAAVKPVGAAGMETEFPAGITNNVMLCAGTVVEIALPETGTAAAWVMLVCAAEEICHTSAADPLAKFARLRVTGVAPACLLITITVKAPSDERTAANDER